MKSEKADSIFDLFFENSLDLLCIADTEGRFVKLNPEWSKTLGYDLSDLEGKAFIEFVHPDDVPITIDATQRLAGKSLITNFTNRYRCKDGSYRWIEWRSYPVNNLIYASARDITDRKIAEEAVIQSQHRMQSIIRIMQYKTDTVQELLDYTLDEAIKITKSTIGYIYHYKDDTKEFVLNSWSKDVMNECKITDPLTCYALDKTGIWGETVRQEKPVIINHFQDYHPLKKGYPPGHVELHKFLSIPIFKDKRIIAVIGVANKTDDYNQTDIDQLKFLMEAAMGVVDKLNAEQALRKSERQYRLLFENMTSGFALHQMIYDEKGIPQNYQYLEANPAFEKLTGISIKDLIGKTILDIYPEMEQHWIKTFGEVAKTGKSIRYTNFSNDLKKYYDSFCFCPGKDQFAVVFNDVTEMVKTEQALKESENRFRGMVENMPIALCVLNIDGRINFVNQTFTRMFGYNLNNISTFEEWTNLAFPDKIYREKMKLLWQQDILHVLKSDLSESTRRLYSIRTKKGEQLEVEISFTIIGSEIYGLFDDVTLKEKAKQELITSEQKFENIFNMSPDMVGITQQANGKIVAGNPAFTELTGFLPEEFLSSTTIELGLWANSSDRQKMLEILLKDGKVSNNLFQMKIKNGTILTCLFSAQAIEFEGQKCLIFVVHDITERIIAEDKIKKNEARLLRAQAVGHIGYSEQLFGETLVWASSEAKLIYGFEPIEGYVTVQDILNCTIERELFINSFHDLVENDKKFDIEYAIQPADGAPLRYIHAVSELERTQDGKPFKVLSIFQDVTEKKKALEALRESEQNYRDIFNTTSDALFVHDFNSGKIIDVNDSMLKMYGYASKEEVLPLNIDDLSSGINGYTREFAASKMRLASENGPQVFEWLARRKNEEDFWTEVSLITTSISGIKRIIASVRDISERKKAEYEMQSVQAILKSTLESMNDGILVVSSEKNVSHYNTAFKRIFNLSDSTLNTKDDNLLLQNASKQLANPDEFISQVETIYLSTLPSEDILDFADGRIIERFSYPLVSESPVKGRVWLFHDITERKNAEKILKEKDERLKNIFSAAPVVIGSIAQNKILDCNEMIAQLTGYTAQEIYGKDLSIIAPAEEIERLQPEIIRHKPEQGPYKTETVWIHKNGSKKDVLLQIIPSYPKGNSGIFTALDITERKYAEAEIIKLNTELEARVKERTYQLEQVNKDLEAFAYSISHDLRAPLRHIDGFARLMYNNVINPVPSVTSYYQKTTMASRRLSSMIDELLSFSRLGRKALTLGKVNLDELIAEAKTNLKPDWVNRNITWNVGPLPEVIGDKAMLLIVFDNLISNAIKYTSKTEQPKIEIGTISHESDQGMVKIYVRDNGAGFDMVYADKLFGVFQRLHTNNEFEGIGIGLANVKQIINKHNGIIYAESEVNKGATFYISLPKT